jgi:hypothetical protein
VARAHADEVNHTTPAHPIGATALPEEEPNWNYQTNGQTLRDQMVTSQEVVNFDKLREIQQKKEENLASFLSQVTEAL